jgi:hypothetical protein
VPSLTDGEIRRALKQVEETGKQQNPKPPVSDRFRQQKLSTKGFDRESWSTPVLENARSTRYGWPVGS